MPGDGLLVGLEIHQQLACSTKLFCACPPAKSEEFPYHFERRLRPAQSETGGYDPAALFEYSKGKSNLYFWNPESSCLVEADEEPPHPLSQEGLWSALLVAATLRSNLMDEVHVMRKIVIDGSNTGGFQRTAVVALGGSFVVDGTSIGVQSVTLEEDAARILGEGPASRRFALDRLGYPLVEVALDPVSGDPEFVGRVALHLGRLLRSTGRVARGLGTIRQDMNVSLRGGKVVEVKGVQKLNLVPKVVEYERRRQSMLMAVAEKLAEAGVKKVGCAVSDVTDTMAGTASELLRKMREQGGKITCVRAPGLAGLVGWEPEPGVRLGKELAEVARANSLGGVIHSDEFAKQGIGTAEAEALRRATGAEAKDALVLVAGPPDVVDRVTPLVSSRLEGAVGGVPAETRAATDTGETRYMRPRPGSQRMYPETDIPNMTITRKTRSEVSASVTESWTAAVERVQRAHSLSADMALKLYDADMVDEFEVLTRKMKLEPSFIASVLVDLPPRLAREGVPESGYGREALLAVLMVVDAGRVAKEAVPELLKAMSEKGLTAEAAVGALGLGAMSEEEIRASLDSLVSKHADLVSARGDSAFSQLMGEAMAELRGRADGALVARLLKERMSAPVD